MVASFSARGEEEIFCRCNEDMRSREGVLLRSIFEFFAVLSHVENRGQMIIEPVKVVFFAEALMRASETKPHLAAHGE